MSLRSQTLEISAASVVVVTSLVAGLIGLVIGRSRSAVFTHRKDDSEGASDSAAPRSARPVWRSLTDIERQLKEQRAQLGALQRSYDLDTGLLKQEILRLRQLLREPTRSSDAEAPAVRQGTAPGYSLETGSPERIRFSSIEDLVERQEAPGTR